MTNSKTILADFVKGLTLQISEDEKKAMGWLVMEKILGIDRTDIIVNKPVETSAQQREVIKQIVARLNTHEPIQYTLEEAWFLGRPFYVNASVLIPRPETEELIQDVLRHRPLQRVLDIGTGSGCIAVTVKLEQPAAEVYAIDISDAALAVAKQNAASLGAEVSFQQLDILNDTISLHQIDVVVSNPPYIALQEKTLMEKHVVEFEPHLALFVTDHDPLIFYRVIAKKSKTILADKGIVLVEINARYGVEVATLFTALGYRDVVVLKDITGKDRMIRAVKGL